MTDVKLLCFSYDSPHGTSALMANLLQNLPEADYRVESLLRKIPNEYVYHKFIGKYKQWDKYGKTDIPHITIATGLNRYNLFKIMDELETHVSPFYVTLGNIKRFSRTDREYDVLYIDVKSPECEEIYGWIRENFNANKNAGKDQLNPHITLSYIIRGKCKELEGKCNLTGSKILIKNLEFKDINNHSYIIKLGSRMKYEKPASKVS